MSAGAAAAQTAPSPAPAGAWTASYNTPGGSRSFKVELKVDGTKLTGTVERPTGTVPLTGTIVGDSVKFSYTITYNDNPLAMNVAAKVTGDSMKGLVDFAGQAQEEFWATRIPADAKKPGGDHPRR